MEYTYQYPHPAVTADCVLFGQDGDELKVLLVERENDPFKGCWAFPGGFMEIDETAEAAAARELEEETGLRSIIMEQLGTFSTVDRDPRGRVLSVVFIAFVKVSDCVVSAGDDARSAHWFPLDQIPKLAFDHDEVMRVAVSELRRREKAKDFENEE